MNGGEKVIEKDIKPSETNDNETMPRRRYVRIRRHYRKKGRRRVLVRGHLRKVS